MEFRNALRNPRYVIDRLAAERFFRSNPEAPWLNRESVALLSTLLKQSDRGLEWGSGRSTLWISRRVAHLVSVEHDAAWFNRVRGMLQGVTNVDIYLLPDPASYAGVTEEFSPESLDFVLVDGGLARDECAHRTIPLLKPGGILILDNANWYLPSESRAPGSRRLGDTSRSDSASWDCFLLRVAPWRHIWVSDGCTCTALWMKP
jgi:predicted O-methyltransferase YrrM